MSELALPKGRTPLTGNAKRRQPLRRRTDLGRSSVTERQECREEGHS